MNHDTESAVASTPVAPLRKRQVDGRLYSRPNEIEIQLAVLSQLSTPELVERARIDDPTDPRYVSSECVLYFVRRPNFGNDQDVLRTLFTVLRQRVLRAVPVAQRLISGSSKKAESAVDLEIRENVLDKFQEMLCQDRKEYETQLDYYECRFNSALASLRATARREVCREASRHEPLASESEPNEPTAEVESALADLRAFSDGPGTDFLYRAKLLVAISSLPTDEQRVVELLLQEYPIDSKEADAETIVKILGCSEKTVRNRRDRAFAKLRNALKEEET